MNINQAIKNYNERRSNGSPRMTKTRLAEIALNGTLEATSSQLLSELEKGNRYSQLRLSQFKLMCEALEVSADELLHGVKFDKVKEEDLSGLLMVMKHTGKSADEILKK